ncbi:TetR family transcriptional regulator [Pseudoflavonifractor sp. 524-17]|uniref:TetR/AcrR family transcriptional regulator n=1 Tax=Pseudoflavonifractor sp. 524-17 TaxID=2304577 RepID=UPI001379BAED|nr:TetR/AcrR family transcriptional regulator [Pseudoflavonifractor sp. 524-17]NCE63476.1 TetR family transcriptional regulator [Pseudoflavonifractor sp. 524-17]
MDYAQRRREQARQTEQAILHAAMELFRGSSFDKVSVRDICHRAGITTGAFYHHFKSKEEMLLRGFAPLDVYMEQAMAGREGEPPAQRLWLLLSNYAAFMERLGWELLARYYQQRLGSPDSRSIDASRFTLRCMRGCLAELMADTPLSSGQSPEWMADFLFRHFRGVVVDWIIHQGSYPLLPKLEQDYLLFQAAFRQNRP